MTIGRLNRVNGVIAVNKPKGLLSGDVVEYIKHYLTMIHGEDQGAKQPWKVPDLKTYYDNANKKRKFPKWPYKIKIGHGGTLDPLASGVLIIGIGSGTKSLQYFLNGNNCVKVYEAVGQFGFATDSYDCSGKQMGENRPFDHISAESMRSMISEKFVGDIMQKPPLYSAIRVNGQRLYDMARSAEDTSALIQQVEIKARPVQVMQCELVDQTANVDGQFRLRIQCGGGCYIRSIIHDLADELGSAGHMTDLIRTQQGPFAIHYSAGTKEGDDGSELIPVLSMDDLTDYTALEEYLQRYGASIEAYIKNSAKLTAENVTAEDKQKNLKRDRPDDDTTVVAESKRPSNGAAASVDS